MENLPNEIILRISIFLADEDLVSLANVNSRILQLLSTTKRTLEIPASFNLDFKLVQSFLDQRWTSKIKHIDFSDCYWVDPHSMTKCILHLNGLLETLIVNGTNLKSTHLADILKHCPNISQLSASFSRFDSTFWKVEPQEDDPKELYLSNCIFYELQENLRKLTHLSLHGDSFTYIKLTVFLCFCSNLKKLHIEISSRHQAILEENFSMSHVVGKFRRQLPSCKNLHQLTSAINNLEHSGIFLHFLCNILSRKESQIDSFWVPGISINQITTRLGSLTALRAIGSYRILQLEMFEKLSSLHTNAPISVLAEKLPHLKTLSCFYDKAEGFKDFASFHKDIEVLQFSTCVNPTASETRLTQGFQHLKQLKKISISPELLSGTGDDCEVFNGLKQLIDCCLLIEEIEIVNWMERNKIHEVSGDWLQLFSRCTNLVKFTLADVKICDGDFLPSILSSCSKLKSLRLANLPNEKPNDYVKWLPKASLLEDFRLETDSTENMLELVESLRKCVNLKRWVILNHNRTPSNWNSLMKKIEWPGLIFACWICACFINTTPVKIISSHPAFEFCFGNSIKDAVQVADIHYNQLVVFDSAICKMP